MKSFCILFFLLISMISNGQNNFQTYRPCFFEISLPTAFSFVKEYDRGCDYIALLNGVKYIDVHSSELGRFEPETIEQFYFEALKSNKINITYKTQGKNWFVISGFDAQTGYLIYWKRIIGVNFVSDLYIKYPKHKRTSIEPLIKNIVKSFSGQ